MKESNTPRGEVPGKEMLIDAKQLGATHYDTFWQTGLRNACGVLQYYETNGSHGPHWAMSRHKDGVNHLDNSEVLCIETELAKS